MKTKKPKDKTFWFGKFLAYSADGERDIIMEYPKDSACISAKDARKLAEWLQKAACWLEDKK